MASKKKTTKKTVKKTTVSPAVVPAPVAQPTKADVLWEKIKGLTLDLFGLPGQTVEKHAQRVDIDPDCLHLVLKVSSVLPALEEVLRTVTVAKNEMIDVSTADKYTIVKIVKKTAAMPFVMKIG